MADRLKLKSGIALIGALVGAGVVAGVYFGTRAADLDWVSLIVVTGLAIVLYIAGAAAQASRTQIKTFAESIRGFLIGMNAAANFTIWFWIFDGSNPLVGAILGGFVALVNLLTVFAPITQTQFFQGILGWSNWLMPMSWPIVALGFLFTLFSLLLAAVTGFQVRYLKLMGFRVDWKTGTFFIKGGLVSNLNYLDTAFNMGNFSFVDMNASAWHIDHEAGHNLNLATFGWAFHLIGALDENLIPGRGVYAYAERMADSNDPTTTLKSTNIPMWEH